MKIGLLECDHVAPPFRHIAGDYRDMFAAILPGLQLKPYDVCNGEFPENVEACDGYLCTGSKYSVYDDIDWIHRLKVFFHELYAAKKPFVGVCFGHQMMAEALGGKVAKAPVGWCVGVHEFAVLETAEWMRPKNPNSLGAEGASRDASASWRKSGKPEMGNRKELPGIPVSAFRLPPSDFNPKKLPSLKLLMSCQDQVQSLPPDSRVLASAADCPVGIFSVGDSMLGLQAHPEFPKAYMEALIRDRVQRIGEEKAMKGIESLGQATDERVVAEWMVGFLGQ
ncbi:MAG: amidotransferase [Lewinellaceae bacterium]|nr:amidotransferase [Lewinellaceae bacterium]